MASSSSSSSSTNAHVATYVFAVPGMTIEEARCRVMMAVLQLRGVASVHTDIIRTEITVSGRTTINQCELSRALNRASGHATLISLTVDKPPSHADQVHSSPPSYNSQLAKEEAQEIDVKRRRVEIGIGAFDVGDKGFRSSLVVDAKPFWPTSKAEETKPDAEKNNERKEEVEVEDAEMLKSYKAIDIVGQETDEISERVSALEAALNCGNKLTNEEFMVPSQLLMSELLKLDTIEAEGEASLQLKAEVQRLLKLHDMLDELKTRNSKLTDNNSNTTSVTDSMLPLKSEA